MFVTSYAETLWFWIIKGILPIYVSDPKMHLGFCHAFRVLESCRNMKSSEESNWFVTMLMLRTEWQRNKLNMHKLCKQYLRWKASAWRNPGNLAAFIFEKLSRKKPSRIHPSRPLIGYRITGRLFLPPFPLQGSIPVFVIKMEFKMEFLTFFLQTVTFQPMRFRCSVNHVSEAPGNSWRRTGWTPWSLTNLNLQ